MKTDQLHFFLFVVSLCVSVIFIFPVVHSKCIPDQQQSLLHFKSSLLFDDASLSSKLVTWNSSTDCCSWVGVTCSINGSVMGLDISSESISGGIDNSSSLFHLQNLQSLNLAHNYLGNDGSTILPAFGELMNLRYLNLSSNAYSEQIPIEIARLMRLVVLDISYNIIGYYLEIPSLHMLVANLTKLEELYLDYVQISAEGSEWCQAISSSLPKLSVLSLSSCNLYGPFHDSLAKLQSLSVIHLDWNNISAPVPTFFANFSNLTSLSLAGCNLHGTFPKEIFQLPSLRSISLAFNENLYGSLPEFPKNAPLQHLDLPRTNFSGVLPNSIGNLKMLSTIDIGECNFTGSIPKSMANLTQLVSLKMFGNKFEGSIPSFSGAKNLEYIDLSSNGLTGNINHITWRNLSNLSFLDLSNNKFTGSIPGEIGELKSLLILNLSNNDFTGPIPPSLSNMNQLESLDLSHNTLSGQIPVQLIKLTLLSYLNLSNNQLEGRIPSNYQILTTFPKSSFEGNKGLFGPPLTEENRTRLSPSEPNSGDEIDWNVISVEIGFACGLVISIASLLFCKGWRIWYYRTMYRILVRVFPQLEQRFGRHRRHVYIGERYWRMLT